MSLQRRIKTRRAFIKQSAMTAAMFPLLFSCGQSSRSSHSSFDSDAIKKFRNKFSGQIILPGDAAYEAKRWSSVINPTMDKHPAIIASCKKEEDVLRSVDFARKNQLEIAVRSGNHSGMGWGTCEKGIVIDLSQMKGITVDAAKRTAIVTTGVTAEEILAATAPYGLAPVLGQCGSVGAGLALGGGLGWLAGKYGATCDNLISASMITAEAEIRRASATTNEDLFWAIRGGGGNFGIAGSFEYRLHAVKETLSGSFFYSIGKARAIVRFFHEFMAMAPDELQATCFLTRDKCWVEFVYFGDLDGGEHLLDNFRKFLKPEQDSVKRRPFSELYRMNVGGPSIPFKFTSGKGTYIEQMTDEVIELVLERLAQTPRPGTVFFLFSHYMHGQVCRVKPDATAFELRKPGAVHLAFGVTWQDPVDTTPILTWDNETFEPLQAYSGGRIYANYMSTPGGPTAKAVFGTNFTRLAQVKKRYDPNNIFHLNQNILPT
jgi:FAD binding domain/Berberine and berberine like